MRAERRTRSICLSSIGTPKIGIRTLPGSRDEQPLPAGCRDHVTPDSIRHALAQQAAHAAHGRGRNADAAAGVIVVKCDASNLPVGSQRFEDPGIVLFVGVHLCCSVMVIAAALRVIGQEITEQQETTIPRDPVDLRHGSR